MLPVRLQWKERSVDTLAFLDDGLSLTLVDQSVVESLGVNDGESIPLCLNWTGNVTRYEGESQRVALEIGGVGMTECYSLNDTRTAKRLNYSKQTLRYDDMARN